MTNETKSAPDAYCGMAHSPTPHVECHLHEPAQGPHPIRRTQGMLPTVCIGGETHHVGRLHTRTGRVVRSAVLADIKRLTGRPAPRGVQYGDTWAIVPPRETLGLYAWCGQMLDRYDWDGGIPGDGEFVGAVLADGVLAEVTLGRAVAEYGRGQQ